MFEAAISWVSHVCSKQMQLLYQTDVLPVCQMGVHSVGSLYELYMC